MKRHCFFVFIIIFAYLELSQQSKACSCMDGYFANFEEEITVAYSDAALIFQGTVQNISTTTHTKHGYSYDIEEFTFSVQNMWKGQQAATLRTKVESMDSCGVNFKLGVSYLIYGGQEKDPSYFSTHLCARRTIVFNTIEQGKQSFHPLILQDAETLWGKNGVEKFLQRKLLSLSQEIALLDRFTRSPEDITPILENGFFKEHADYLITGVKIHPLEQKVIDGITDIRYSYTLTSQLEFEIEPITTPVNIQDLPEIKRRYATEKYPSPTLYEINETIPEKSVLRFDKPIKYKGVTIPANQNILEVEAVKNSFDGSFLAVYFPDVLAPEILKSVDMELEDFIIPHGIYHIYFQWGTAFGQIFSDTIEVDIQLEK